tara:strand:- start:2383 stop:2649 length:267 start_codon:yes stop_codon:yes gene_type:complete
MIKINKIDDNTFSVKIIEKNGSTGHVVSLDEEYYHELVEGKISKEELIKKSFEFLLEREPKESILSKFNLKIISSYFPKYVNTVRLKI